MKFGKSLIRVMELNDPEWGPYWINYKFLKKKISNIVHAQGGVKVHSDSKTKTSPSELSKSACEIEFFKQLKSELKKTSDFFASTEQIYNLRKVRIWEAYRMLKVGGVVHDKNTWTRLLMACFNFYRDLLLLEHFAIMSCTGYNKILKKHDKQTGFNTRTAYMSKEVMKQNFADYPHLLELIKQSENLFAEIQSMESVMPLQDEERLFIEAIRDLNYQASMLQSGERADLLAKTGPVTDNKTSKADCGSVSSPSRPTVVESCTSRISLLADSAMRDAAAADATGKGVLLRKTSFNPYHGPSFITAIPDSSTPYISSMCVVDPSDRLDAATSLVIDAAMRLNNTSSRPNLQSIMSWVSNRPGKPGRDGAAPVGDKESAPTTVPSVSIQPIVGALTGGLRHHPSLRVAGSASTSSTTNRLTFAQLNAENCQVNRPNAVSALSALPNKSQTTLEAHNGHTGVQVGLKRSGSGPLQQHTSHHGSASAEFSHAAGDQQGRTKMRKM